MDLGQRSHAHEDPAVSRPADPDESALLAVPLAQLRRPPEQPRKSFDTQALEALAATVRSVGVIEPLLVRPSGRSFEVISGERRRMAAELAGLTHVPCIARPGAGLAEALVANLQREGLSVLELALGVTALSDEVGPAGAAARLGKKAAWVTKLCRIGHAPDFLLDFAARGGTHDAEALYELAKLAETDPDAARAVISFDGPKSGIRRRAREARTGSADRSPSDDPGEVAPTSTTSDASATGARRASAAISKATGSGAGVEHPVLVDAVHLQEDTFVLETEGAEVKIVLTPDVERELFELLRVRLTS